MNNIILTKSFSAVNTEAAPDSMNIPNMLSSNLFNNETLDKNNSETIATL